MSKKVVWMNEVEQMKARLDHKRNHAVSMISAHRFLRRIKRFDAEDGPHWTVGMRCFTNRGVFMCSTKLLSGPKKLTRQDFFVHYSEEFHKKTFAAREQWGVNIMTLHDKNTDHPVEPEIIQIVMCPEKDLYMNIKWG
jgi:hypothetical protein